MVPGGLIRKLARSKGGMPVIRPSGVKRDSTGGIPPDLSPSVNFVLGLGERLYPGESKPELERRRPDEANVDDYRGRRRAGQLRMVPDAVRSACWPSCP